MQVRYLHAAAITAAQLARLVGELQHDRGDLEVLKLMLRRFQGLAAWAGLHGLATIAVAAQLGEHDCATLAGTRVVPEPAHLEQIGALVGVLRQQIYRQRTTGGVAEEIVWAPPAAKDAGLAAPAVPGPRQRALAVGLREVDWVQLESLLLRQGFALQAVETCREAGRVFATDPPQAVIAAADLPDGSGTLLTHYLRSLDHGDEPVILLAGGGAAEGSAALAAAEPATRRKCRRPATVPKSSSFAGRRPAGCDADARFCAPVDWHALALGLGPLLERRRSAPRVLYLESDDELAGGVRALLDGAGYRVRPCRDLRRFAREVLGCAPDLLLIDLAPAAASAAEVVRRLRSDRRCATVPVILLTAEDGEEEPAPGRGAEGIERIAKPVAAPELLSRVAARIEHHRALADLFAPHAAPHGAPHAPTAATPARSPRGGDN
ncbi:MAG: hypothetical protein JOZ15_15655 [Acidobacteria bacterium]|nr:hypothetical protein [Acidobacteriota bacterium]